MRLYRSDPAQLDRVSRLQTAKNSAEEVLHPADETERSPTPSQLRAAYDAGRIVALPRAQLLERGVAIDRGMGELAGRLKRSRTTYRGLRKPGARRCWPTSAPGSSRSPAPQPLVVTSTVRDKAYQRQLLRRNREATPNYSLHTTGWSFDVMRTYASRAQALAFEFMLERLQSHNLIAWVREPAAIHVTVSRDADRLAAVLDP